MMRRSWVTCLDTLAEEVLDVVEDQGGMVDGIDLNTKKLSRHASGHASREVVYVEFDFHLLYLWSSLEVVSPC